ncbi:4Fe-4S dicluster domain-containing protein [Vibrio methylphosphonaticus]|uniref:4Fe-4S dicluster domain-containing protein n=1 Tax=Vibrio methylphosphonaticus TaxID=2946866 RepID=UPI002029E386|nr:4Fe-4S dicluster domain-containing protein [Vibrio methylphosphonaticus]MCL9774472.1 4Fe-4S binding protein [Vibrio methylphosphonaticus]
MPNKDERYYKAYMEHKTISRRGLFRALSGGARVQRLNANHGDSTETTNFELASPHVTRTVARPPGAVDEFLFQQICSGCAECVSACPEQVISLNEQLAELTLDYGYCAQCNECQQVCPTGALHGPNRDTLIRPVFASACQNALFGDCSLCAEQCPSQSISIRANGLPVVDGASCDGCGRCKQACPFTSIALKLASA